METKPNNSERPKIESAKAEKIREIKIIKEKALNETKLIYK